jgi:hypothetical protein
MKSYKILFLFIAQVALAQTIDETVQLKLTGYVKNDFIFDSRQNIYLREGHFLLYPANELFDPNGVDVNGKSSFNALSIQTRVNAKITGAHALGANISSIIEGEFFGTSDSDVNGFRLRHAFIALSWNSTTLLVGQTWHPMFIADVFPQVVSFNTGVPFQPFSRNPQIRLTQSFDRVNVIFALCSQRDFTSNGPNGFSSLYLRNSVLPNTHLQVQYKSETIFGGIGLDYKILTPRLETAKKFFTNETVSSFSTIGYLKLTINKLILAFQGTYGGNNADLMMLGGYGVKSIDSFNDKQTYEQIKSYSIWLDAYCGTDLQPGLFLGYSKNLGSTAEIVGSIYSRVNNIDNIFRISPRLILNFEKIRIASEVEITSAAYGTIDNYVKVINSNSVTNVRCLIAVYYFF